MKVGPNSGKAWTVDARHVGCFTGGKAQEPQESRSLAKYSTGYVC